MLALSITQPSTVSPSHGIPELLTQPDSRLPPYRSLFLSRYHPYGRTTARRRGGDSIQTVGCRFYDEGQYRPSLALSVVEEEDEEVVNNLALLVPVVHGEQPVQPRNRLTRVGIVELVVDLALAMRRRFRKSQGKTATPL
ncbi:uncharacterized protein FIBRA_07642 [Fibroporia radiculosa]|uniref:Uncharacterized protein n=1 Tax=Fibroporia radiculosa TaxID=599839 RepID=J4GVD7_9APHY|nr:uncharacterized protein FIBRA_07642 [Fibroporia radiculosa]CCM05425.1 predicted protein [Fibroporia radiculosa]